MITEPTLEHYIYYLRQVEGDNSNAIQERRAAFEEELKALLAHLERLSSQAIPAWEWPQESEDRRVSQRIVRTGWLDNPATDRSCFVEARTYGNVYWLQVGYYQRGQADPEIFANLRDEAWRSSARDCLLGSSSYLCGIAADKIDQLAAQVLAAYTGDTPGTLVSTHIADGRAGLYGSLGHPHLAVLFYPTAECEEWAGRIFLNDIALRLELYKHKADRQLAWCEENIQLLSEQERALRDLLEEVRQASPADQELLQRFIRLYRVFNGNVGMLADRQTMIEINLENLETVIEDLGSLTEDHLLGPVRDHLRRRQRQLEADLKFADQARQQAERAISALRAELGLDRLVDLQTGRGDVGSIERVGFPGGSPTVEMEIDTLIPEVNVSPRISLTTEEKTLLQHVYRGFGQVLVEEEFGGGYGGARVFLILPVTANNIAAARRVTKIGPRHALRRERDNYVQYVGPFLPFCAARVERYHEQADQAGLDYVFAGDGALGQVMTLEEYYRGASPDTLGQLVKTLDDLLDRELGQRWYGQAAPLPCFFAAEYSQHMVEHLRLKLRPASSDALWSVGQSPPTTIDYRRIEIDAIPREYETMQPGTLLSIEGMIVRRLKPDEVKLEDPGGQGIVVRVEFVPGSNATQELKLGDKVGVRGEVVYNRRGRMEHIVREAFPDLSPGVDSDFRLPGVTGRYPNPLRVYPRVLGRTLEGRQSYVHGDLHLRNVLVDEWGRGWLIDFARVEKRHNLFDFIKLETYVRLMGLARVDLTFSLGDYVRFEEALADATLGRSVTSPKDPHLLVAYEVILVIRRIARNHMVQEPCFLNEYFPALFLYCLSVMKYYRADAPQPARLVYATASVLARYLLRDGKPKPKPPVIGDRPAVNGLRDFGHRWAAMAGVNVYQDRDISDLTCCVNDVQAIHCLLTDPAHGGYQARLLLDITPDTLPTRNNVLAELNNVARAAGEEDLLLFYFSGHGAIEAGEAYLIPRDARLTNLGDTAIPLSRVKDIMAGSAARAKVIILDACHSGARIGKAEARMSQDFMERVFAEAEGLAILASCQQGQVSYEWEQAGQSVFTHYLLEGLAGGADFDNKGFVTIQDINRYVADRVKVWAVEHGRSQTPTLGGGWSGDIVVGDYREEQTLLGSPSVRLNPPFGDTSRGHL